MLLCDQCVSLLLRHYCPNASANRRRNHKLPTTKAVQIDLISKIIPYQDRSTDDMAQRPHCVCIIYCDVVKQLFCFIKSYFQRLRYTTNERWSWIMMKSIDSPLHRIDIGIAEINFAPEMRVLDHPKDKERKKALVCIPNSLWRPKYRHDPSDRHERRAISAANVSYWKRHTITATMSGELNSLASIRKFQRKNSNQIFGSTSSFPSSRNSHIRLFFSLSSFSRQLCHRFAVIF